MSRGSNRRGGSEKQVVEALEQRVLLAVFSVTNVNDAGAGSLRWAIEQSNAAAGVDAIRFNIGGGDRVIRVGSELPGVYDPAVIDATTQPGYAGRPLVQIDGAGAPRAGGDPIGLKLFGNSVVKGLSITRFLGDAIHIVTRSDRSFGGNIVQRNWLGVDLNGQAAGNRAMGVGIYSAGNLIGGPSRADGNVISASTQGQGVYVSGANNGNNTIQNNLVGTDPTGGVAFGNYNNGVFLSDSPNNRVLNNVISGNGHDGVFLFMANTTNTLVQANFVGLDATGTKAIPNGLWGMEIQSSRNVIGGKGGAGNVVSGNMQTGIVFYTDGARENVVRGNYVGTDVTGTKAVGNMYQGVAFAGGSGNAIVNNVISGNGAEGIGIFPGAGTVIQGNTIGAGATYAPLPNGTYGITVINGSRDTTIGGGKGAGNYIAHNLKSGIYVTEPNTVVVNNVVHANGGDGVQVAGQSAGNRVEANSIYENAGLGINLGWDGVSANDSGDWDGGPNGGQNFPVITSAVSDGRTTTIKGTLNSAAGQKYTLWFYSSPTVDGTGYGEGKNVLGSAVVTTDAGGNASFTAMFQMGAAVGAVVSATATDSGGNTSEFSAARAVGAAVGSAAPRVLSARLNDDVDPNHLVFVFSADVSASLWVDDFWVKNVTTGRWVMPVGRTYDKGSNTAKLWYPGALPDGAYEVTVGGRGITDAAGNRLTSYTLRFSHLAGDLNRDGAVNKADRAVVRANFGKAGATFAQGDLNYDGKVDARDSDVLEQNWYRVLPGVFAA